MVTSDQLKQIIHSNQLSRQDKALVCLGSLRSGPVAVAEISKVGIGAGLREITRWNLSDLLKKSRGMAIRVPEGWELTPAGKNRVRQLVPDLEGVAPAELSDAFKKLLGTIEDPAVAAFVEESLKCFESGLHRAAVVLSWVGALAVLYLYVIQNWRSDFNAEAVRRDPKWKHAKTPDELARMKERDFLDILEAISVIGKSVKNEMVNCLNLRNACGHPNSFKLGKHRVAGHVEFLIQNVYSAFPL